MIAMCAYVWFNILMCYNISSWKKISKMKDFKSVLTEWSACYVYSSEQFPAMESTESARGQKEISKSDLKIIEFKTLSGYTQLS